VLLERNNGIEKEEGGFGRVVPDFGWLVVCEARRVISVFSCFPSVHSIVGRC
jgi:hypothetical protein